MTAKRIFSGRLALIPKARKTSWKSNVNRILEDAMVEVSEAPILLSPMTYKNAAAIGTKEKKTKNIKLPIPGYDVAIRGMRNAARIKPEMRSELPDTSMELCLSTSLVMNIIPAPKVKAEHIASKSPNVIGIENCKVNRKELLDTVARKPDRAMTTPASCFFRNLSFRNNHARTTTITASSGPAKRPSFVAPTLVTESYHRKTAAARNIEPLNNNFHDLNTVIFLSEKAFWANISIAPAIGILMPAMKIEDMPGISVRNSTIIDSNESIIA
jgi:hypothetical protein